MQIKIKFTSKGDKYVLLILEKVELPQIKNRYKNANIKNKAPN
jgi:hypothetical protein